MNPVKQEQLNKLSEFYKIFSDTTRLRILNVLLDGEMRVNDIVNALNLSQSLVSHQLKNLRAANFVKSRRNGKEIIYSISDNHIKVILEYGLEHIGEDQNEKEN